MLFWLPFLLLLTSLPLGRAHVFGHRVVAVFVNFDAGEFILAEGESEVDASE
jgi:hypothetical protein